MGSLPLMEPSPLRARYVPRYTTHGTIYRAGGPVRGSRLRERERGRRPSPSSHTSGTFQLAKGTVHVQAMSSGGRERTEGASGSRVDLGISGRSRDLGPISGSRVDLGVSGRSRELGSISARSRGREACHSLPTSRRGTARSARRSPPHRPKRDAARLPRSTPRIKADAAGAAARRR